MNSNRDQGMNPILAVARREVANLAPVSEATRDKYLAMILRLIDGRVTLRARSTARLSRAALIRYFREGMAYLLALWDKTQDPNCLTRITNHVEALNQIRGGDLATGRSTHSKRKGMESLPPAWVLTLIDAAEGTELRALLSVVALTGIRPAELEKGVWLTLEGATLATKVSGAKVDEVRGHEFRTISIPLGNPLADNIVSYMREHRTVRNFLRCDASVLRRSVTKLAHKVFPDLTYKISPYSLRHSLSSGAKHQKLAPVELARILGHRCTKSQTYYGRASLGQVGLLSDVRATTSGPVKDNARNPGDHPVVVRDTPVPSL